MNLYTEQDVLPTMELLVVVCSLVLLLLLILVIILFSIFQKRKILFITERNKAEMRYQEELTRTQLEIQEATLKNVSWELHDNIGQLLSVANLELNMLHKKNEEERERTLEDIRGLVGRCLMEIRAVSRNLNNEVITQVGLAESVRYELNRLDKLGILKTSLIVEGDNWKPPQNDALILFRIIQEFLTNVIKHAKAAHLQVLFQFSIDRLYIAAKDDGIGFNIEQVASSSGLINMRSRAALINADFNLTSQKSKGTSLIINYLRK